MLQTPVDALKIPKRIMLIALSAIPDDPRVRRMGDYLHARGWEVVAVGLPGGRSPAPEWRIVEAMRLPETAAAPLKTGAGVMPLSPAELRTAPAGPSASLSAAFRIRPRRAHEQRLVKSPIRQVIRIGAGALCFGLGVSLAASSLWMPRASSLKLRIRGWSKTLMNPRSGPSRLLRYAVLWRRTRIKGPGADAELYRRSTDLAALRLAALAEAPVDLIIANDWISLPVAAEAAEVFHAPYVYDSHEFATEEYAERLDWRLFQQPLVREIERRHIARAAAITSVSPGISDALARTYEPAAPVMTLRNLPVYAASAYRLCGERIAVLYHGVVGPGRGLEAAISGVPTWPAVFDLTIRGPGQTDYINGLRQLAVAHGVTGRVTFDPPVPMNQLVESARPFDIGLMALPGHSDHNAFALPNKVFEYLMAGLAICVSDLPEMARVVHTTGAGFLCGDGNRDAIAKSLARVTPDEINVMKQKALVAAQTLHFDAEAAQVEQIYQQLAARRLLTQQTAR